MHSFEACDLVAISWPLYMCTHFKRQPNQRTPNSHSTVSTYSHAATICRQVATVRSNILQLQLSDTRCNMLVMLTAPVGFPLLSICDQNRIPSPSPNGTTTLPASCKSVLQPHTSVCPLQNTPTHILQLHLPHKLHPALTQPFLHIFQ